jgi:hypothetical protein
LVATYAPAPTAASATTQPRRLRFAFFFSGPCLIATPAATAACTVLARRRRSVGSCSAFFFDLALPARDFAPRRFAVARASCFWTSESSKSCST